MHAIEIYTGPDKQVQVEVTFENDTFWLSLNQISELFERDKSVISRHLKNIFKSEELSYSATVAKNATVQFEAGREVIREIEYYNLDAILSVGYRVNSKRGSQFRQWATQRLKDYLAEGYSINKKRLEQLQKIVDVIQQSGDSETLQLNEAKGLLNILGAYSQSFILLNQFDSNNLQTASVNENITYELKYEETKSVIAELKNKLIQLNEASDLFGKPKDESFKGILGNIVQTFDGKYLYPGIEEQAAHLLYFVIKNHPFSDGNKRIDDKLNYQSN